MANWAAECAWVPVTNLHTRQSRTMQPSLDASAFPGLAKHSGALHADLCLGPARAGRRHGRGAAVIAHRLPSRRRARQRRSCSAGGRRALPQRQRLRHHRLARPGLRRTEWMAGLLGGHRHRPLGAAIGAASRGSVVRRCGGSSGLHVRSDSRPRCRLRGRRARPQRTGLPLPSARTPGCAAWPSSALIHNPVMPLHFPRASQGITGVDGLYRQRTWTSALAACCGSTTTRPAAPASAEPTRGTNRAWFLPSFVRCAFGPPNLGQ